MSTRDTFEHSSIGQRIIRLREELDAVRPLSVDVEARVLAKLRLDWNYHSNAIEGNSLDHGETRAFLMHGITAKGKPLKDYLDIRGHNGAIDFLLEVVKGDGRMTESDIRNLHKEILVEPYDVDAVTPDGRLTKRRIRLGVYKSVSNTVRTATGAVHQFKSPEETPILMQELMAWVYGEGAELHPVERSIIFHHRFVSIHPFDDGNGRMGRLLMNLLLMQADLPPAVIRQEDRGEYYAALAEADGGDLRRLFDFVGEALLRSMEVYLRASRNEPIDEPDDVDKEIAMLERDLETRKNRLDARYDEESRRRFVGQIFAPFWKSVESAMARIGRLFLRKRQGYVVKELKGFDGVDGVSYVDASRDSILARAAEGKVRGLVFYIQMLDFRDASNPFGVEVRIAVEFDDFKVRIVSWVSRVGDLEGVPIELPGAVPPDEIISLLYPREGSSQGLDDYISNIKRRVLRKIRAYDAGQEDTLVMTRGDFEGLQNTFGANDDQHLWIRQLEFEGVKDGKIIEFVGSDRLISSLEEADVAMLLEHIVEIKGLRFHPQLIFSHSHEEDPPF